MKFNLLDLPLGYGGYNKDTGEFIITLTEADTAEKERVRNMLISQGLEVRETGENQFTVKPVKPIKAVKKTPNEATTEGEQNIKSAHAEYHISPKDKLTNAFFGENENFNPEEFFDSTMTPVLTGVSKKFFVLANFRFEDLPEKLQGKFADLFTRAVHDAVISLITNGEKKLNEWIRLEDIAWVMNGYSNKRKATPAFLKQIESEFEWLMHTWGTIDATAEVKAKGWNIKETSFNRPLIPSSNAEIVSMNGQRVKAYKIYDTPLLYAYAKQKKQVITVPLELLVLPDKINMTRGNIILQHYLLSRIDSMKKGKLGYVIDYKKIYQVLNATEASKAEKMRIRERVRAFLDNWVDLAYIAGYQEESKNRAVYSVRIDLDFDKPKAIKS